MPDHMSVEEAIKHDRTERREMSRRVYAEATGITENRVHALEHGRRLKPGEITALRPFIGDLIDPALMATDTEERPEEGPTEPIPEQQQENMATRAIEEERMGLGNRYLEIMQRLNGRIPPYPWPSQYRLETAPRDDFHVIDEWIRNVDVWIRDEDGEDVDSVPPAPETPSPSYTDEEVDEDDWYDPEPTPQPTPAQPAPETTFSTPPAQTIAFDPNVWYVANGEMTTFADCPRRWYLQNYRRVGPPGEKVTGPAMMGTRFHEALEAWYQPEPGDPWEVFNERTKERQQQLETEEASEETFKEFNSETDMVRAMIEGYFAWVQETSADVGLTIIGSEQVVLANPGIPGLEHVRLIAKLDVRAEDERDGARRFLDHKTVGSFKDALKGLVGNEQMLTYHLIEYLKLVEDGLDRELRTAGALYNMARKVKRTAQAKPPFYMREPVTHNLEQLQAHWQRIKGRLSRITEARAMLDAGHDHHEVCPPRWSDSCSWKCEFFALCPMMDHTPAGAEAMIAETLVSVNPLKRYEPAVVQS